MAYLDSEAFLANKEEEACAYNGFKDEECEDVEDDQAEEASYAADHLYIYAYFEKCKFVHIWFCIFVHIFACLCIWYVCISEHSFDLHISEYLFILCQFKYVLFKLLLAQTSAAKQAVPSTASFASRFFLSFPASTVLLHLSISQR